MTICRLAFRRYFTHCSANKTIPVGSQLQLLRTTALVAADSLRGVIHHPVACLKRTDALVLRMARFILGLPGHTSAAAVWALSQLTPTCGIVARDTLRVYLQIQAQPYRNALSLSLFNVLRQEPMSAVSTKGKVANWVHTSKAAIEAAAAAGATLEKPRGPMDVSRVAHAFGRSVGYAYVQRALQRDMRGRGTAGRPPVQPPPDCCGSRNHFAALSFSMSQDAVALGTAAGYTPLSIRGPGCSGSLLAIARDRKYPACMALQLGTEALHRWPFDGTHKDAAFFAYNGGADAETSPENTAAVIGDEYSARFSRRPCPLCSAAELSTFHVVCECQHPLLLDARASVAGRIPAFYTRLAEQCTGEIPPNHVGGLPRAGAVLDTIATFSTQVTTDEDKFILYWTLAVSPWPASAVPQGQGKARALGVLFDSININHRWLRTVATTWLGWAEAGILDLAAAWRQATAR